MTLPTPDPSVLTTGGGHTPDAAAEGKMEEMHGPIQAGEAMFFSRGDTSPLTFTPDGAEVEQETPPAISPLAVEFNAFRYTISECGKYEVIGDRRILRKKELNGSQACFQSFGRF